ncbi:DNA polymerase III subunit delta [Clostridium sp. AM58-1XD]|uniref:DNA polymerase III subunit delta n=1 Tax=Clostridium sp. AM58-1XD TaxID=2292307 RepID=UPI000E4F77EC|nr:DNA polymerase III subunit delta [Clostridium sp. AM58-1XD]RGY96010.1 DNA polymerase III subunit delta [Clostridium sp. AM58-1XD]
MQTLNQDMKDKSFKKMYLLYGEEAFLKRSYKNRLKDALIGDDTMNYNYFEGKGIDVSELISLADTMPFFTERRLILVEDSGFFKSAAGEELVTYLPSMPDTTCFLFVESEVDKRNRLYKKVKELGHAAEMTRQNAAQLATWAGTILSKEGKKITRNTMELFLSMAGDDMENIKMELEKLVSYTGERDVVTDQDVREICTERVTSRIFDMVAAIVGRKTRQAMDLYEDLLTLKEPPMRILFLIARQFNQILQVKELMGQGMDKSSIASRLKMQPFVVGKTMPQARAFTKEQILSYVTLCVDMEEAVKTGKLQDRLAVELLITNQYH